MFATRLATLPAAVALAAVLATPAAAREHGWLVGNDSMRLYLNDLDLNSAAGRAGALTRVERAAVRLCRDSAEPRRCERATVAQATAAPGATALRLALLERQGIRLAVR